MKELEQIQAYWNTHTIYKEAGAVGTALGKTADLIKNFILLPAVASIPITTILAANAYNKINSPSVVAKNMDKRLLLNTLDTEIAIAKRQIAEIEAQQKQRAGKDKPYDRFV